MTQFANAFRAALNNKAANLKGAAKQAVLTGSNVGKALPPVPATVAPVNPRQALKDAIKRLETELAYAAKPEANAPAWKVTQTEVKIGFLKASLTAKQDALAALAVPAVEAAPVVDRSAIERRRKAAAAANRRAANRAARAAEQKKGGQNGKTK